VLRPRSLVALAVALVAVSWVLIAGRGTGWRVPSWVGRAAPGSVVTLAIHGSRCLPCAAKVERELRLVPHVLDAQLDSTGTRVEVRLSVAHPDVGPLLEAAARAGYQASVARP